MFSEKIDTHVGGLFMVFGGAIITLIVLGLAATVRDTRTFYSCTFLRMPGSEFITSQAYLEKKTSLIRVWEETDRGRRVLMLHRDSVQACRRLQ